MTSSVDQNLGHPSSQSSDGNNPIHKNCTCRDCMREFSSLSNPSAHRELHHKKPRKFFNWEREYQEFSASYMHYLTHGLIHECKVCGRKFSYPYLLRRHEKYHKGVFRCTGCKSSLVFADSHSLIEHRETVHNKEKIFNNLYQSEYNNKCDHST